jgi:hypothetical protein
MMGEQMFFKKNHDKVTVDWLVELDDAIYALTESVKELREEVDYLVDMLDTDD